VDGVQMAGGRRGGFGGGRGRGGAPSGGASATRGGGGFARGGGGAGPTTIPVPDIATVSKNWPTGNIELAIGDYMLQPHQQWTVTPVANVGGYPGSPYFKITVAGTDRALAATADADVVTVPAFTGGDEQLWRIDQLTDGTYRIMPKSVPDSKEPLALTAVGNSTPSLTKFDPDSDKCKWDFRMP
jgi:arabinan endo-1,5-alpha-L-arabinosidase